MAAESTYLTRRNALKGAAATGALSLGGGLLLFSSSQPALAADLNISGPATATSDDGSLNYVRLEVDHELTWDGFDSDVEYLRYIDRVTVRPNDQDVTRTVNDTTSASLDDWSGDGDSNGWGGDGEYSSGVGKAGTANTDVDWNVIGDPNATDPAEGGPRSVESPADLLGLLEADSDGNTKSSKVVLEKDVRLLDGNQNQLDSVAVSDSFVVEVTNQAATADATASGTASADGDNVSP